MAISLYDVSVTNYLQTLGAASHFLARGLKHCQEHGLNPEEVVEARVIADMLPFRFQVQSLVHHSVDAIDALKNGVFHAVGDKSKPDYQGLQAMLKTAQESLSKLTQDEVNARQGADVVFDGGNVKLNMTAEDFVLSFSLPNLHFHAATAYGILRSKGVPLGKRDYMGRVRLKP